MEYFGGTEQSLHNIFNFKHLEPPASQSENNMMDLVNLLTKFGQSEMGSAYRSVASNLAQLIANPSDRSIVLRPFPEYGCVLVAIEEIGCFQYSTVGLSLPNAGWVGVQPCHSKSQTSFQHDLNKELLRSSAVLTGLGTDEDHFPPSL
jgi:hypothetical protein